MYTPPSFNKNMNSYYQEGRKNRLRLSLLGNKISNFDSTDEYNHSYIYSVPGLGKTHMVNESMKKNNVNYVTISGNVSMWAFGVRLALINYVNPDEITVVSVDDCNEILKDTTTINIMKNVLEGNRVFHYQKHLGGLLGQIDDLSKRAVESHIKEGQPGFIVPTNNMIFVFTANERLPYDDEVNNTTKKVKDRMIHLNAIRSRCRVYDFELEPLVQWGWIADVMLNCENVTKTNRGVIVKVCEFMYKNWDNLKAKSIRIAKMMAEDYRKCPNDYELVWEMEYLK